MNLANAIPNAIYDFGHRVPFTIYDYLLLCPSCLLQIINNNEQTIHIFVKMGPARKINKI